MKFSEVVTQTLAWLQREERVSYRALKLEFDLNDDVLDALKEEIIDAKRLASDENGKVLVWTGAAAEPEPENRRIGEPEQRQAQSTPKPQPLAPNPQPPAAERRQLTVMFCDLVGSTALSARLDPEDYRAVVQHYHATADTVLARYDGHVAQHLGDGLLVYFGYPVAHEDDARRAVRAGVEIVQALQRRSPSPFQGERLQVRIGIHTGLVVVGEIGSSEKREMLALGETPNVAARIQGLAEPNTVLISAATQRLVGGQFEYQPFGSHLVKGFETPIAVYHVQGERQNVTLRTAHTTPLVGREQEVGLLCERWEQVKEGRGQVVLLTGEPGIGKSRLTQALTEQVSNEGSLALEAYCSPYHQNSAFYPLIEAMQRGLFTREDTPETKVGKLERALTLYDMADALPLFTALLSLPVPATALPLNLTPQKQKERTIQAMVRWWLTQAERQATVSVWEDLHWADPSTLEFLTFLLEQVPTSQLLVLLTARPEFISPWPPRSHFVTLTLNRLGRRQTEAMIAEVAGKITLPTEVTQQILAKTDGVPLFVEELTKMVLESAGDVGARRVVPLPLAIPPTLQDALMARLDRLNTAKELAQLGATLGREFSYELLQAISPLAEDALQQGLRQLVETELVYQRGIPPQASYTFKHALIQDAAYQSLLKSRRQQLHQQIAQILEERFPDTKEFQPELLAHHYTEAGLIEQAVPCWQQAGQGAITRWANEEAIRHLTTGLKLLAALPETPERIQLELTLQALLGMPLMMTKGWGAPEVKQAFTRAFELSQHSEETPQLFPVLLGLAMYYGNRAEYRTALGLAGRCMRLADHTQDSELRLMADCVLGVFFAHTGEFVQAREHCEQGLIQYDLTQHHALGFRFGLDPGATCGFSGASVAWYLGYPDQALTQARNTWTLAQKLSHPLSQAAGFFAPIWIHLLRREPAFAQEQVEPLITLVTETEQVMVLPMALMFKGIVLAEQGQGETGLPLLQQGWASLQALGARIYGSTFLLMLARTYGWLGRTEEGLAVLAETEAFIAETGECWYEAELYRLKGELTLQQQFKVQSSECKVPKPQHPTPSTPAEAEAEACFLKAIDVARKQQAKSWELRAVMSLTRLRQQQATQDVSRTTQHETRKLLDEARTMLSDIYHWFTEGFDTKDLQEAKALIEELGGC